LSDKDPDMLAYFEKIGLMPNVKVKILGKEPFNGPITIQYKGTKKIIGNEIASSIYVETI
jgi:Fe2+ transport system protein FeoA